MVSTKALVAGCDAGSIISRLERERARDLVERDVVKELPDFRRWHERMGLQGWEAFCVPEINHYEAILKMVTADDVVFDVGAGDLRLDLMLAEKVKRVYAVEVNPRIIASALQVINYDMPGNLMAICGDAFRLALPDDVTLVICLMIHRRHDFPDDWFDRKIVFAKHDGLYGLDPGRWPRDPAIEPYLIREGEP
jgi:SAM-dependent methyltransferase